MALNGREIAVLGAGIGGLCAALALVRRGARVQVLEQAPALTEVGAGIQISQNGMTVLRALEVFGSEVPAVRSGGVELRDWRSDRPVLRIAPPRAGPTWFFHRADLLAALERAARDAGVVLFLGQRAEGLEIAGDVARLRLADGSRVETGCLVAADGVRGVARAVVADPGPARFTGQVAWRAVVPVAAPEGGPAVVSMGPGRHVVTYPLRGGTVTNLVAVEERRDWTGESWRQSGDPAELRRRFGGFGGATGRVLSEVREAHLWALHLHPVAPRWHRGPVALLGDAAHPTLPFMAQGACLAIEDAWVLAESLEQTGDFARYEALRRPRAERVVAAAAGNAWKFHLRSPIREVAQIALRLGGRFAPDFDWIYGHDVTR